MASTVASSLILIAVYYIALISNEQELLADMQ